MYCKPIRKRGLLNETLFEFLVELGTDLVAAHALDFNQHALLGVVLQHRLAGLLELLEAGAVRLLVVIWALDQGLAGDVVAAGDAGGVEGGVVDAAGGLVDPSAGDALHDDGEGCLQGDDQVHGDDLAEDVGLGGGAGEAVEDEGGGWVVGGLRGGVVVEDVGCRDDAVHGGPLVVEVGFHCGGLGGEGHDIGSALGGEPATGVEFVGNEAHHQIVCYQAAGLDGALDLDTCETRVSTAIERWGIVGDIPSGVLFLTLLRRRSPVLMDWSWGNRWRRRSLWVPLPTPGAPKRMTLAALFNLILGDRDKVVVDSHREKKGSIIEGYRIGSNWKS